MLYFNGKDFDGPDQTEFLEECWQFLHSSQKTIKHCGGEFFAANHNNAQLFIDECGSIFKKIKMLGLVTHYGDEFITSIAAKKFWNIVDDASSYVCRCWTRSYYYVPKKFQSRCILHCPAEKNHGFIQLYNRYIRKGKLPKKEKVVKMLHLDRQALSIELVIWLRKHFSRHETY